MSVVISRLDPQCFDDWEALLDLILDAFASMEGRIELTGNHAIFGKWGFVRTAGKAHAGYARPTYVEMRKAF